jgi:hypothetical protein
LPSELELLFFKLDDEQDDELVELEAAGLLRFVSEG